MARMHTRRKGKSCSKRPMISENPAWVPLNATEIEDLIVKLAKDGMISAKIGLVLRDQYGVDLFSGTSTVSPTSSSPPARPSPRSWRRRESQDPSPRTWPTS